MIKKYFINKLEEILMKELDDYDKYNLSSGTTLIWCIQNGKYLEFGSIGDSYAIIKFKDGRKLTIETKPVDLGDEYIRALGCDSSLGDFVKGDDGEIMKGWVDFDNKIPIKINFVLKTIPISKVESVVLASDGLDHVLRFLNTTRHKEGLEKIELADVIDHIDEIEDFVKHHTFDDDVTIVYKIFD